VGRLAVLGRKSSTEKNEFFLFFLFPANIYFWKMKNSSKREIEKVIFSCGKIQEIENIFSTVKEKVYSPVFLNRHDI